MSIYLFLKIFLRRNCEIKIKDTDFEAKQTNTVSAINVNTIVYVDKS